ncbi:hypothetical protein EKG40_25820 [Pseudomonas moorei]|nr:hypothetical protein EKG40_25820 [Pseudomonas moorei]
MTALEKLLQQGFPINSGNPDIIDLALVSLRIALKSYFSSYQTFEHRIRIFKDTYSVTQQEINENHPPAYFEASSECIIHFQHFAELVCKNFLRAEHPMLADNVQRNPVLLHGLIHNTPLTVEEQGKLNSVEFSEALDRLEKLIASKKIKDYANLTFFTKHTAALKSLNNLRNRIWHRGLYILEYRTLDQFIGAHILPFVVDVMTHPFYSGEEIRWKHKELNCKVDPISEIISHFDKEKYSVGKVALLKELGRAAYINKITPPDSGKTSGFRLILINKDLRRAERIAQNEAKLEYNQVTNCPVCGIKSLIQEEDTDHDYHPETGEPIDYWRFTHSVICENCTFSLGDEVENASSHGLTQISDYFSSDRF